MPENTGGAEKYDELTKLSNIATDMLLNPKLRIEAINVIGAMKTHEALLALLALAANDRLNVSERDLALRQAREVIKSGH